jgi:hypothetical protein
VVNLYVLYKIPNYVTMKKIFIFCLLLAFTINAFSQADTAASNTSIKTDYLRKSKNQKTTAWVLLGGGVALMATGILVAAIYAPEEVIMTAASGEEATVKGVGLFLVGGIASLASIPFFIASGNNKHKALSVSFKNESAPQLRKNTLVSLPVPSIRLVVNL